MDECEQTEVFLHRERARQLIDLTGFGMGDKIHPTDIDAVIEWNNKAYVFMEFKYEDAPFPEGQRLCLERLVNDAVIAGKGAIAILARHHVRNGQEDVDAAEADASAVYFIGSWRTPRAGMKVGDIVAEFLEDYGYRPPKYDWQKTR